MRLYWWACPYCADVMARTLDRETTVRDQKAHLLNRHPEKKPSMWMLKIPHWNYPSD